MPSQAGTEACLLKPATRTDILAIFMTQGKKEGAGSSGVRSLEAPWVS
jgi:BarA-like signal transduction histidine kinase